MRRWLLLPLVGLLMLPAAPASAASANCAREGSETVRVTEKVRVYRVDEVLYGCVRKSGVTRELFNEPFIPNEFKGWSHVRVAGHRVAWATSSFCTVCGDGGPFATVNRIELRSGDRSTLDKVRKRPEGVGTRVDALALDRCGRIAYRAVLADAYDEDQDPDPELHTWVGETRRRVDRGAIVRRSIRLEPDSVHWERGGKARSAPLAPTC